MEASPVNTILHEWHFDPDFSDGAGTAKRFPSKDRLSFSDARVAIRGDIPPGSDALNAAKGGRD